MGREQKQLNKINWINNMFGTRQKVPSFLLFLVINETANMTLLLMFSPREK